MMQPVEQAFLKAILAEPDSDAPRLAYANWLSQQGKPRGEFIRLQLRLENLPHIDPARPGLEQRAHELRLDHQSEWLEPIQEQTKLPWALLNIWTFKRGFVDEIGIDPGAFVEHAAKLFALEPIRVVRLIRPGNRPHLGDRGAVQLAGVPELARCRQLQINDHEIGAAGARALVKSPHLQGLAALILDGCLLDGDAQQVFKDHFGIRLFTRQRDDKNEVLAR
ncbi:MAG: TIGR02996 domain-containing protein [Gemmataceae bacterium]